MPVTGTPALAWIILIFLSLIWGTSFILIKKGLEIYSPDELGALRITLACLFLLPFAIKSLGTIPRRYWKWIAFSGFIGNLIPAFLFAFAETELASGLAGVLNSLTALFTLVIGAIFFQQRITGLRIAGIIIGIGGTAVLIFSGGNAETSGSAFHGFLVVLATVMYGGSLNIIKHKMAGLSAIAMASLCLLCVGPFAFVYLFSTEAFTKITHTPGAWEALGYIALLAGFSTAIGLVLYNKLIHMTTTLFASSSTYLMPIVALLWGVLDGETIHLYHYGGMLIILLGVFIVNRAK
ncbi:DMT family transporter [Adhaeribacter sp. BT258]|uniref:DMT family transporter n=1 Tax=Adhaeribacter terrigena TaxID=2793070 RepID=A0ABS1C6X6_9BACT|nr:DMT family transporter [Adhaeribacter terrigena]MBK0404932.1 DMT family transporter [Adhaeribacter terrigena]